jgi:hypothetical protein
MMDAGCYCAHVLRFLPGSQPRVLGAWPRKLQADWFIDREMKAAVEYPGRRGGLTGALQASLVHSGWLPAADIQVVGSRWAAGRGGAGRGGAASCCAAGRAGGSLVCVGGLGEHGAGARRS